MLFLKKGVRLKDLEKYGFYRPSESDYDDCKYRPCVKMISNDSYYDCIHICNYDDKRYNVSLYQDGNHFIKHGVVLLYKMIQDGLIENIDVEGEK